MSVNSETLRRLAALKLPDGALSEVLSIIADMQSDDEERKKKDRERKRKIHGNSEEIPWKESGISEGDTVENQPYKDNHASAPVCSNGSSLRSEPVSLEISPLPSVGPQGGEKKKKSSSRGTRLPSDWTPSERSIEICLEMGYSRAFVLGEGLDGFRGYWLPLPGAKAFKLDWDQTFCNRMRERTDRARLTGNARAGPERSTGKRGAASLLAKIYESNHEQRNQEPANSGNVRQLSLVPSERNGNGDLGSILSSSFKLIP
jgi:hypothetical protein